MVESSDEPSLLERIRSKAHASILGLRGAERPSILPLSSSTTTQDDAGNREKHGNLDRGGSSSNTTGNNVADESKNTLPPPAPPPTTENGNGEEPSSMMQQNNEKRSVYVRFWETSRQIMTYSYINLLLVFVPIGIASEYAHLNPQITFGINAVAIIPLAGLLSHATEAVAASLGDTVGALLNVTFGNAVELIVFIIALTKDEIGIVQASIVGSILSNLLLILGMAFALGGLRYREQIYNSTVTQMSACLLSLSVTSLLLPTAFHASFKDNDLADDKVLELSRASAIILLVIYVMYLLFQLKSHAYMYASTPQHVIDEESQPGLLANMLNSSSSSDTSSTSDTDSDGSSGSHRTAKKIKRVLMRRSRRKSSASSKDTPSLPSTTGNQSYVDVPVLASPSSERSNRQLGAIASGDEADVDGAGERRSRRNRAKNSGINARDFEKEKANGSGSASLSSHKKSRRRKHRKHSKRHREESGDEKHDTEVLPSADGALPAKSERQPRVGFVGEEVEAEQEAAAAGRRPLNLRSLSSVRPAMPKILAASVFSSANPTGAVGAAASPGVSVPRAPYGLRRTSSLPDRLNKPRSQSTPPENHVPAVDANMPPQDPLNNNAKQHMSRTSAVILLLASTGLVALCAEYLVGSINYMVENSGVSQAFIGLIILPIVSNAAEHVTAVTVATKNKMDLAIGVAIGSSIQIALFVTPLVILLAWCMGKELSLFFSLFETISLFGSAFIINFLILDGRSNYLEGALLIAAYIIIAIAAWYYPNEKQQSDIGGAADENGKRMVVRSIAALAGWDLE